MPQRLESRSKEYVIFVRDMMACSLKNNEGAIANTVVVNLCSSAPQAKTKRITFLRLAEAMERFSATKQIL